MTVLTLAGKPIDWFHPPKPTDKVRWSKNTTGGRPVIGSFRTICHLDMMDQRARKRWPKSGGVSVMQSPYNEGVEASEGTHDRDACIDAKIEGVPWLDQQWFWRTGGAGAYYRTPAQGFVPHIHYFVLPPLHGGDVSDDYMRGGFVVGEYVDGGWSLYGRRTTSSQIEDYYAHRTALEGHLPDPTKFPANIAATIFNLNAYVARQRKRALRSPAKPNGKTKVATAMINVPIKVGVKAWRSCFSSVSSRADFFGINESFSKAQRNTYASLAKAQGLAYYGLRKCGNPIFWEGDKYTRLSGNIHRLHPKADNALAKKYPGFNAARDANVVVLRRNSDGVQITVINTHLAPGGKKVDAAWRKKAHRESRKALRRIIRRHIEAGRVVVLMGDMNVTAPFWLGSRAMKWLRGIGIDKVAASVPGKWSLFPAPTDHKHGVRAILSV